MKALIVRMSRYRLVVLAVLMQMISTSAFADCHIVVSACPAVPWVPANTLFRDAYDDGLVHSNANRCMKRAREYLLYCGIRSYNVPNGYAMSAFETGQWKTLVVVTPFGSQLYVLDLAGSWSPIERYY